MSTSLRLCVAVLAVLLAGDAIAAIDQPWKDDIDLGGSGVSSNGGVLLAGALGGGFIGFVYAAWKGGLDEFAVAGVGALLGAIVLWLASQM